MVGLCDNRLELHVGDLFLFNTLSTSDNRPDNRHIKLLFLSLHVALLSLVFTTVIEVAIVQMLKNVA